MKTIVIIPCKGPDDSGKYLMKTLEHIYYPIPYLEHFVLIVDDNPNPAVDIGLLVEKYPHVRILHTGGNIGCAGSRNFAVQHAPVDIADDDILVFLDAHMNPNLHQDEAPGNFLDKISRHIAYNPKRILCGKCYALDPVTWYAYRGKAARSASGAELEILGGKGIIEPRWISSKKRPLYFKKFPGDPNSYHIPLIHGACYAMTAGVFRYLEGFSGLKEWGSDEVYLCLKAYVAGPREYQCGVMEDVRVGHVFIPSGPHPERREAMVLNKFRVVKELFPSHLVDPYIELIRMREPLGNEAYALYREKEPEIAERRAHWEEKFTLKRIESWLKSYEREFSSAPMEKSRKATPFLRKFTSIAHAPRQMGTFFKSTQKFSAAPLAATATGGTPVNTRPPGP
jgi:hypothetical protein